LTTQATRALNAICPYFTMFPLEFPLRILARRAGTADWVLDPFSGRGTTNYAARLLGLPSIGIDSSRVAIALTEAKLANTTPDAIFASAERILSRSSGPVDVPKGEFWTGAFHRDVLEQVCRIREALFADCRSASRKALRAVLMGALHGPRTKTAPSHLSNQCTRTYAPKPRYAVNFWRSRGLRAPLVDVRAVIRVRAERYFTEQPHARGLVLTGDSRSKSVFDRLGARRARWIVTSPPYYGMRTYIPDQWLRNWFLGGPSGVEYSNEDQLDHGSPRQFADQLSAVWQNVASVSSPDAQLVIRFGGIADRKADPLEILKQSLTDSPWVLTTVKAAGSADSGRRQAIHFSTTCNASKSEFDAWTRLQ
jgi:DNA methylase